MTDLLVYLIISLVVKYIPVSSVVYHLTKQIISFKESLRENIYFLLAVLLLSVGKDSVIVLSLVMELTNAQVFFTTIANFLEGIGWCVLYYYLYKA